MGKGHFYREGKELVLSVVGQVLGKRENFKILGSSTCQSGGGYGYLVEQGTNGQTSISKSHRIDWKSRHKVPYYLMSLKGQGGTECKSLFQ